MDTTQLISFHGGHSGQYCSHAVDSLEEIIQQYIALGFTRVGITEHVPPAGDCFLYPDEKKLGLTAHDLVKRFGAYMAEVKALKKKYASHIQIFAGMETETYTGYADHITRLIFRFRPDYIVGSVHHIDDICFDYSREEYDRVLALCGSYAAMYEKYFDLQYDMIKTLKPFVVGHFDLIRIHDDDYEERILIQRIHEKIKRNLALIKSLNLVMDFNLRPLAKGRREPYITASILKTAKEMGIRVVPGDDAHGVKEAGLHVDAAIKTLETLGFDTQWPDPVLHT